MRSKAFLTFSAPQLHWQRGVAFALVSCAISSATWAQTTAPLAQRSIAHRVSPGDTLEQLARRYLGDATLWPALQSHNQVPSPYRLQPGSVLEIPLQLMRAATASVDYVQGNARISRSGTAAPIAQGAALQEGDRLQLDPEAFVSVRLADGSTVRVQANSQVELSQLRRRGRAGSLQSVLEVQKGAVEVNVPAKTDTHRHLEVITPVAATSVRGTVFDVQLTDNGSATTAVLRGQVAVQPMAAQQPSPALLSANTGMAVAANGQASSPTPLLPAPSAQELPSLNEDAQWLDLSMPAWPQAQGWRVSVSRDAQGQQVLRNGQFKGARARFAAIPDGHYFVHARALDQHGISGLPAVAPLRVKAHPVPPLVQALPAGGVLAQDEAQFQCTQVDGVRTYRHQIVAIAADQTEVAASAFAQPALAQDSADVCQLDLQQLPAGHYAWRAASVRMVDGKPDQGPFAPAHPFRIAPRPAALSLDAMQLQSSNGITTIHWKAEPGQRFRLQAFATPDGTAPALDAVLDAPQWTAAGLPAGTWHVRIQVQDPSGLHSAFSPPRSVQVLSLVQDGSGQAVGTGFGLGLEHP